MNKKPLQVKILYATEPCDEHDLKDALNYIGKTVFFHPGDDPYEFEPGKLLHISKNAFIVEYDAGSIEAPFIFVADPTAGGLFTENARLAIKTLYERANWLFMNFSGEPIVTDVRPLLVSHAYEWKHHDPLSFIDNLKNSNLNRYVDNPKNSLINLNKLYGTLILVPENDYDYYDY